MLAAVLVLGALGCTSRPDEDATALLAQYFSAVQAGEAPAIAALLDDCRDGRACSGRIAEAQASVAAQRVLDAYRFDDEWGLGLSRALVLGAGGFWRLEAMRLVAEEDGVGQYEASLTARTQYRAEETVGLPFGALIEYQVAPLGTVRRLARGESGPGAQRLQLVEVQLIARLTRRADGWRVAEVRVLPETAVFETVSWRPQ